MESFPANVLYEPQDLQPIERWQRWRARVRAASGEAGGRQKGLDAWSWSVLFEMTHGATTWECHIVP